MSMDMIKERIRELNHRQKVRFSTLLLPILVAWNTLNTRGSTASCCHIEILKSCNSYRSMLFGIIQMLSVPWVDKMFFSLAKQSVCCQLSLNKGWIKFQALHLIVQQTLLA